MPAWISCSLQPTADPVMFRSLFLLCIFATAFGALPKGWKACSRSDSKYSQCQIREITNAVKSLINGDKKLGVLPLDPLRIEKLQIGKGTGSVAIELLLNKVDIKGLKDFKIKSVKTDWKKMDVEIYVPKLIVLSDYKVDGKVLVLPITGQGRANLTFDSLSIKGDVNWKEIQKGNTKYFSMDTLNLVLQPNKLHIKLDNLFNGDKALGDNMNKFLDENWDQILTELKKPVSEALSVALIQIANQVLNKIPSNEFNIK